MTACMRSSRAVDNPALLIACSLRSVSTYLDGRLGLFRRLAVGSVEFVYINLSNWG